MARTKIVKNVHGRERTWEKMGKDWFCQDGNTARRLYRKGGRWVMDARYEDHRSKIDYPALKTFATLPEAFEFA